MPMLVDMIGEGALPHSQGHPNWVRARVGHLCGSELERVVKFSKGEWSRASDKVRTRYMQEIVAERMEDAALNHYVTDAMRDGIDREPDAIAEYEKQRSVKVYQAEFILHPTIAYFGGTPDGLVGRDGGVEIKCPTTPVYVAWRQANRIPDEHVPQMLAYLMVTGRQWWDFAAFNPKIKHGPKMFMKRYVPVPEDLEFVAAEVTLFLQLTDRLFRQVTETSNE